MQRIKIVVFYSWQSDRPRAINRDLIQEGAQLAIDRLTVLVKAR